MEEEHNQRPIESLAEAIQMKRDIPVSFSVPEKEMGAEEGPRGVLAIALIGLLMTSLGGMWYFAESKTIAVPSTPAAVSEAPVILTPPRPLIAKAAYVFDGATGAVLYEKNAELQLPLASITKLMTAVVASEILSPESKIVITPEAILEDGSHGLTAGEPWSFENLLKFTLITSSNDGAHAIAEGSGALQSPTRSESANVEAFVALMNQKAKSLGLTQTYFLNTTGLDMTETLSGSYGSARDVAMLMNYIIRTTPAIVEGTRHPDTEIPNLNGVYFEAKNTNKIIGDLPGLIASKTGFTTLAGGNLVIAFDAGLAHPIIIVVLGSTEEGRMIDVQTLVDGTLTHLEDIGK